MKTLVPPPITSDWRPSASREGLKKMRQESPSGEYFEFFNWYVQDDKEAAANYRFFGAAPAMAEALARLLPDFEIDESAHDGLAACEISVGDVKAIRAALLSAGYTEAADQE